VFVSVDAYIRARRVAAVAIIDAENADARHGLAFFARELGEGGIDV
jgi:hypothetical protein